MTLAGAGCESLTTAPDTTDLVCGAADTLEENDSAAAAKAVPLSGEGRASVAALVRSEDDDFYQLTAPKSEPIEVSATYSVAAGGTPDLRLTAFDTAENQLADHYENRAAETETMRVRWRSGSPGDEFILRVRSNAEECTPYTLEVRALACTDGFEDDDDEAQAKPVALSGVESRATLDAQVAGEDDDFFEVVAPLADPMSVVGEYTVADGTEGADLRLTVFDEASNQIDDHYENRTQATETMSLFWHPSEAGARYRIRVRSNNEAACTPYDLTFEGLACTDSFEDNDAPEQARALSLDPGTAIANAFGTAISEDDDFFELTAPRSDPVEVVGSYSRPAGDNADLRLTVFDAAGNQLVDHYENRSQPTEEMAVTFQAEASALYRIRVRSNSEACSDYELSVRGLACTDDAEDNDTPETARALAIATTISRSVRLDDEDYYLLTAPPASGTCTLRYSTAAGERQDLRLRLLDAAGNQLDDHYETRTQASEVATVSWSAGDSPAHVRVNAAADECTSYTLDCR